MHDALSIDSADESATERIGAALAAVLPGGAVVALVGPLGAGKTRVVQAVARAAGVADGCVTSPTFVLVHEYLGRLPIYHFDAYRLSNSAQFSALGPEEYFVGHGWSFVEWADRVHECLPPERLEIHIEPTGVNSRRMTFSGVGSRYDAVIDELRRVLHAAQK